MYKIHFCFRGRLALQILQTDLFSPTGTVYSYHGSRTQILSLLLYVLLDYTLLCSYMTLHKLPFQHQIDVVFYVRNNADIRINITRKHHQILEHFEKFEMTSNMAAVAMMYLRFLSVVHWITLRWRHDERDCVSNHQPHYCLLSRLFRYRSKETSKLRVTGLCAGHSPGTGEFLAQRDSYAENSSLWWLHHAQTKSHSSQLPDISQSL